MPNQDNFQWARKVSRRDIQRLYDSEARGLLDEDLLDEVMYMIHARIRDMFEVRVAQQTGQVRCRSCDSIILQPYWMGGRNKGNVLKCDHCSWETTCGEFFKSYTGKDLLPGSRTDLFQEFLDRFPAARTPQEKMLLLDWLIHAFHSQAGVSSRLVAMNVIQGSRHQLIELLSTLASSEAGLAAKQSWLAEQNNPIRSSASNMVRAEKCWRWQQNLASAAGQGCRKTNLSLRFYGWRRNWHNRTWHQRIALVRELPPAQPAFQPIHTKVQA